MKPTRGGGTKRKASPLHTSMFSNGLAKGSDRKRSRDHGHISSTDAASPSAKENHYEGTIGHGASFLPPPSLPQRQASQSASAGSAFTPHSLDPGSTRLFPMAITPTSFSRFTGNVPVEIASPPA